ncbi:hypothetical protein [Arthrobacter sp. ISL-30]|uniref:hypothetical protein n=1 Tax=Arthrobacter sp. ISL-30 TaxID=2819109 RepID=UPI001BE9B530|nr:hypothetical protein [Arthrobacter sp. ISL-30]MBT2515371.1 hypothetical protein [Arthrobacter sp. ISL-30]
MTENQWPQDGSYRPRTPAEQKTDAYGNPLPPASTPLDETETYSDTSGTTGTGTTQMGTTGMGTTSMGTTGTTGTETTGAMGGKADVAKEEASEVARQAKESARGVAETAKSEAANVAEEAKSSARNLLDQAKTDLTDQAGTQQQKVAQGLKSVADQLRTMANASDQPGVASDLVKQAAERSTSIASWLEGRDPGSLLDEVKSFARQRPGTFLLIAAGAGVLAGRLSRSLSAGAPDSGSRSGSVSPTYRAPGTYQAPGTPLAGPPTAGTAVPPPTVELPGPDVTTAGAAGGGIPSRPEEDPYFTEGGRQI